MGLKNFCNSKHKKMNCADIGLVKLSVFAFALMLAKLWTPLLGLNWYWYALIFVIAAIIPLAKVFK